MTKRELVRKLIDVPNDADICLVGADGKINDIGQTRHMPASPGLLRNDEVYLYPTKGRV